MTYDILIQTLRLNSNKSYDDFNNTVINSDVPTIGCTVPFVRKLAKQFTVEEVETFPVYQYFEVDLLRGIVVSKCKLPFTEKARHLVAFAETIENWAVCDCSSVKIPNTEKALYFEFFCDLLSSDKPFMSRFGVVNLLASYLDVQYIDRVFTAIATITQFGHYYVDMGVAWLIATAMTKCRDKTVAYMQGEGRLVLNKFTYNKALQKMRESYRVSAEDKQWTYTMKKQ